MTHRYLIKIVSRDFHPESNRVNNYAIDTAGIGEALQRSAASFNFANTDLDEAIALIAGTNEATQNPSKVGNMWRTVSLRMRAAKQELEEMGEDTEGMIESTSKLRDYVMTLTGFDIMKSETEFKSLYEMVVGIGKEMDKLSDIDRTAFLETLAGKNQANMLAAALQNWEHVQEAYQTSLGADDVGDGIGSATKELENYQKSIEYSIGQFKAAFQELSTSTIQSDFLKGIVDAGTKAIEIVTKLVQIFGNLKSVIAGFSLFKFGSTFLKGFDQFKMIGDVTKALKKGSDLSAVSDIVKTASSLEDAASILNRLDLPIADKVSILKGAFADAKDSAIDTAIGIDSIKAASAGATTGITGIGTALKAAVVAHPWLALATAISAVVAGVSLYRKNVEEAKEKAREAAEEAGNAWMEQQQTLEEQMERVVELRESIDSGDLNDQEIYDAKLSILEIQEEIVGKYGEQASGVDLVNGSLETQISLLQNITKENAKAVKAENLKAINEATFKMTSSYNKALFGRGASDDYYFGKINSSTLDYDVAVQNIFKKYADRGIELGDVIDGEIPIYFTGDSKQAVEVFEGILTDVMDVMESIPDVEIYNPLEDLYDSLLNTTKEAKNLVSESEPLYDLGVQLDAYIDEAKYEGNKSKTSGDKKESPDKSAKRVVEWGRDYRKAIREVNEAFTSGDGIEEALNTFNELDEQIMGSEMYKSHSEYFDNIRSNLNETALAVHDFKKALSEDTTSKEQQFLPKVTEETKDFKKEVDGLRAVGKDPFAIAPKVINEETVQQAAKTQKSIHELSEELKGFKLTDLDLKDMFITSGLSDGEEVFNSLIDSAKEYGIVTGDTVDDIQPLIDILIEQGVITEYVAEQVETSAEEISTAYDDAVEGSKNALTEISNAITLLNSGTTGKSVDVSIFDQAEMMGYASALEYVNGSIQVNQEKVRELTKAQAEAKIAVNDNAKALKQQEFKQNATEISELTAKLRELEEAGDRTSTEYQNLFKQRQNLRSDNEDIIRQCNQLDLYTQSLREATGAYQEWLNQQNAPSEGDMARDIETAIKNITDAFDPESDAYQRFGNTAFESAEEWLIPRNISNKGREAINNYVQELGTYFGDRAGSEKFLNEAIDKGLLNYDPDTGAIQEVAGKTYKDFAQAFNWKESVVQAMFGEVQEFFPELDFSFADNDGLLDSLSTDVQTAATNLSKLAGLEDIELDIDVSGLDTTEEKVTSLESTIEQLQETKATLDVNSAEYQDAVTVIEHCVAKKQELEKPAIMHLNVDQSGVDTELQNALSLLQQFQTAQNQLEMQAAVGANTEEAEGQVNALVSQIEGLSPEIKATLGLGEDVSAESIKETIGEITVEGMVKMGVNRDAIDKESWDKDGEVKYTANRDAVDAENWDKDGEVRYTANTSLIESTLRAFTHREGTITYRATVIGAPSGVVGASPLSTGFDLYEGTAHASGTAKAKGDWGNIHPGWALTGEVGEELLVIE